MEDPALCPAPFTQRGLYRDEPQIAKREFASSLCFSKLWQLTISCKGHPDGGYGSGYARNRVLSSSQTVSICC
jgi:hypothetical protein